MGTLVYVFYLIVLGFIRFYKFVEFQAFKLFIPLFQLKAKEISDDLGIVLHDSNDNYDNRGEMEKFAEDERQLALTKYSKILHFKVHNTKWFARICNQGILAAGETYMEKMWDFCHDVDDLSELFFRVFENDVHDIYYRDLNRLLQWAQLDAFNLQHDNSISVLRKHCDLGLYEVMLDPYLQYSCGYWRDSNNLADAQISKMELVARKLDLKPGMRLLDISCQYGTLCKYLAENYHVHCVGIYNNSKAIESAKTLCSGTPVDIRLMDYRQLEGSEEKYDRILCIDMFEHVGHHNYRKFFEIVQKLLMDDGMFLLQTVARNTTQVQRSSPFSAKYNFPNFSIPSPRDIVKFSKDLFVIEDWQNLGTDYAKTLYCWRENFINGWPKIQGKQHTERFYRMWIFYLSYTQALFRARKLQEWQIVLSKHGLRKEYRAAR